MTEEREEIIKELVREAHAEDERSESGHFDREGWVNFFLEDWKRHPELVIAAWRVYENEVYGSQ